MQGSSACYGPLGTKGFGTVRGGRVSGNRHFRPLPPEYAWFEPVLIAAIIVFIIDVVGSTIAFSSRPVLNALVSAVVFAIIFGFLVYYGYGKVEMSVSTTPQPSAPAQSPPSAPAPTPQ
jgi:hypothetical protein